MDRRQRLLADRERQYHCRMISRDFIGLMLRSSPCPQGEVSSSKHVAAPSFETSALRRAAQDEDGAVRSILLICALFCAMTGTVVVSFAAEIPLNERKSGYEFMGPESRAMQDDDSANPASLWVLDGEAIWKRKAGTASKSCADCHGEASDSMKGVAARYPAFSAARGRPVNLDQQINVCRTERQQATPLPPESKELLALNAYVARQSRGMPINTTIDEQTRP